jgi:hypothetical protein
MVFSGVMRRRNLSIWLGLLVVLVAAGTYLPLVERFPSQGGFPSVTLLVFAAGLALIARGLVRAYREPGVYRGKIAGPAVMALGTGLVAIFAFGTLYLARQVPSSEGAPRVGDEAPGFTLRDTEDRAVSLETLLGAGGAQAPSAVVLIFYRGYW